MVDFRFTWTLSSSEVRKPPNQRYECHLGIPRLPRDESVIYSFNSLYQSTSDKTTTLAYHRSYYICSRKPFLKPYVEH